MAKDFAADFHAHYSKQLAPCPYSERLKSFPGYASGIMGLTPDSLKRNPEWIEAKREAEAAFKQSQVESDAFNKKYKKELAAWRRGGGRLFNRDSWPKV